MKEFKFICGEKEVNFNFPTSLKELDAEYLKQVTANIKVADYYALIGLVYHDTIGSIILTRKQNKKDAKTGVIPVFIKAGNNEQPIIKDAKCKDVVIIAGTQLQLGHHVSAPLNKLSLDYVINCIDKDITLFTRYKNFFGNEECYFVEFKIVPISDIVGVYDSNTVSITDPYVTISDYPTNEQK